MADIQTFRAFRYGPRWTKTLPKLVCPPYDVISPEERKRLEKSHPQNFVRVELPAGDPAERYARAARTWKGWLESGVLARDAAPDLYLYESVFSSQIDGRRLVRRGFFAALKLVPWGKGVYPHEKTLPTPKADRLKLFKALRAQTSPIQCLFEDPSRAAGNILAAASRRGEWLEFSHGGVRHRFRPLSDPAAAAALQKLLQRSAVAIADGHHRYETSRAYSEWARAKWGAKSPASHRVMAYFSPSNDPSLEILPTHRAVGWDKRRFVQLEKWGRLEPAAGLRALERLMKGREPAGRLEVGLYREGKFYRYRFSGVPASLRSTPHRKLAVACLHAGPLLGLGKEDFFFTRKPEEAVAAARRGKGWAFFLAPNSVAEVMEVATAGHVMPPKSTYFYPKMPSGLVSHSLFGGL